MNETPPNIIKKYANRRLYDTQKSRYVTLEDLRKMILEGDDFRVIDSKGEDITSNTLLHLLLTSEVMGQAVFSEQSLRNMIMFVHGPMREPMKIFVEQCLPVFLSANEQLTEKFGDYFHQQDLEEFSKLQGNLVRQLMEQYVCRGLENYLDAQKNIRQMFQAQQPFFFNPLDVMKNFTPPSEDEKKK